MFDSNFGPFLLFVLIAALIVASVWGCSQIGRFLDWALNGIVDGIGRLFGVIVPTDLTSLSSREQASLAQEAKAYAHNTRLLLVACMAKFSKIDGVITKNELATVEAVFESFHLTGEQRPLAIATFRLAKTGKATFRSCVQLFLDLHRNTPDWIDNLIGVFFDIAHADGDLNPQTRQALVDTCRMIGIDYQVCVDAYVRTRRQQAKASGNPTNLDAAYKVLSCQPTDALNVVKDRYRKLVKEYHPDTVMSKDLAADFIKFAEDRFKQIQAAYETVMEARAAKGA